MSDGGRMGCMTQGLTCRPAFWLRVLMERGSVCPWEGPVVAPLLDFPPEFAVMRGMVVVEEKEGVNKITWRSALGHVSKYRPGGIAASAGEYAGKRAHIAGQMSIYAVWALREGVDWRRIPASQPTRLGRQIRTGEFIIVDQHESAAARR